MRKFGVNPGTTKTGTEQHAIADSREKDTPPATRPPSPSPLTHTMGVGPQRATETWAHSMRDGGGGRVGGNTGGDRD